MRKKPFIIQKWQQEYCFEKKNPSSMCCVIDDCTFRLTYGVNGHGWLWLFFTAIGLFVTVLKSRSIWQVPFFALFCSFFGRRAVVKHHFSRLSSLENTSCSLFWKVLFVGWEMGSKGDCLFIVIKPLKGLWKREF